MKNIDLDVSTHLHFFSPSEHENIGVWNAVYVHIYRPRLSSSLLIQIHLYQLDAILPTLILYFSILLHSFNTEYLFFCPSM
jgi:hypothetical protein